LCVPMTEHSISRDFARPVFDDAKRRSLSVNELQVLVESPQRCARSRWIMREAPMADVPKFPVEASNAGLRRCSMLLIDDTAAQVDDRRY
jgi:hypothetical protein